MVILLYTDKVTKHNCPSLCNWAPRNIKTDIYHFNHFEFTYHQLLEAPAMILLSYFS